MPHSEAVNWQPISEMPLIASMIDEALDDTRAHIKTLTEASARPHVMDDATVDRIDRVHVEQMGVTTRAVPRFTPPWTKQERRPTTSLRPVVPASRSASVVKLSG